MIQIGERVVVSGWAQFPTHVTRIYWEDKDGNETDIRALATVVMLELEWDVSGTKSKSRVKLHQENEVWYRYAEVS